MSRPKLSTAQRRALYAITDHPHYFDADTGAARRPHGADKPVYRVTLNALVSKRLVAYDRVETNLLVVTDRGRYALTGCSCMTETDPSNPDGPEIVLQHAGDCPLNPDNDL